MNICQKAAIASNKFENCNTELKRKYFLENINIINLVMRRIPGYCGSFGTGYPFYALDSNLEGQLPIIKEQLRYNNELSKESKYIQKWLCEECLKLNSEQMPDLKQICKPCPQVKDSIKPRKVVNRLPDIDMWMICRDDKVKSACKQLREVFDSLDMYTSDVDPVRSINDIYEIATDLESEKMPQKKLPLDIHIIEYSRMQTLLEKIVPSFITSAIENISPYLAIHPLSLRKTWQYDDEAYNFVLDYLFSLTPFNWQPELNNKLLESQIKLRELFSQDDLKYMLDSVAPVSVKKRLKTKGLEDCYKERIEKWKK